VVQKLDKLILLLLVGLALFIASPKSAAAVSTAESRASGSAAGLTTLIRIEARLSESAVRENIALGYDIASDDAVAARGLRATDFGSKATLKALERAFRVEGQVATVSVRNIEGNLGVSGWDALNALKDTARAAGATTLRIEGTIGNPAVLRAMERMLGPASRGAAGGAQDVWVLGL
jgi:hypothetical protein